MRWTPAEFLQQAKKITHPMNPDKSLGPLLKDTLFDNLTRDPLELAKSRIQAVITIKQMAQELEEKEKSFKATLDPIMATVLKPKRILLWRTLLMAAEYDDIGIVDLVSGGVPLTGSHGRVQALPEKVVPATDSHDALLASASLRGARHFFPERGTRPPRSRTTAREHLTWRSREVKLKARSRSSRSPSTSAPHSGSGTLGSHCTREPT